MTKGARPNKRLYLRPEISKNRLAPAEAILAGCKINLGSRPGGRNCKQRGPCVRQGS